MRSMSALCRSSGGVRASSSTMAATSSSFPFSARIPTDDAILHIMPIARLTYEEIAQTSYDRVCRLPQLSSGPCRLTPFVTKPRRPRDERAYCGTASQRRLVGPISMFNVGPSLPFTVFPCPPEPNVILPREQRLFNTWELDVGPPRPVFKSIQPAGLASTTLSLIRKLRVGPSLF